MGEHSSEFPAAELSGTLVQGVRNLEVTPGGPRGSMTMRYLGVCHLQSFHQFQDLPVSQLSMVLDIETK